ncbi:MAG: RICIN domain-containing protein [Ruminococcus sp.]|nr:RICIN domain-containing protein [Ruminococcus sp.]
MRFKKLLSGLTSAALALTGFAGTGLARSSSLTASAATTNWKFDFGGAGTASGYTGVSASDSYSSSKGYGFTGSVSDVSAGGPNAVADAVKFSGGKFNVDLPKGLYQVTVTIGDSPRFSVKMEGMLQMMNLTRLGATETIQIPVTDGQLNIETVEGISGGAQSIAAVEITQLNTTGEMKPTVWICGDSTVANYYNQADTAQHGWGQYLNNYINTNVFEVRNMATSGQYAKGFYDGGQFTPIEYYGKSGDYFIVSIGINDTNYSNADEYKQVVTTMVTKAKAKGMNVILVKQQGRHGDLSRSPVLGGRWFGGQLDAIAAEQNVTVVDLFTAWQDFGFSIGGYDAMTEYYATSDDLHQSAKGAQKNAELVQGLMKIGDTEMDTSVYYTFKNTNSGLVMDIAGGAMEDGTNVQQWGDGGYASQKWQLTPFMNGTTYYYVHSVADQNYVLKMMSGSDGGNLEIAKYSGSDTGMLFQFTKIGDGSYYITSRPSKDTEFVEVASASTASGANVQQWAYTYSKCQNWQAVTSPATTTAPETTTTTTTTTTAEAATTTSSTAPVMGQTDPPEVRTSIVSNTEIVPGGTRLNADYIKYRKGDANKDGKVNIADAIAILQNLANSEKYPLDDIALWNADIDDDGLTGADAITVQMADAGAAVLPETAVPVEQYITLPDETRIVTTIIQLTETTTQPIVTTTTDPHYYAVDQVWEDSWVEDSNTGFTKISSDMGTTDNVGYINFNNVIGSSLTFTVNVESKGNYMTHIRFANGAAADRQTKIFVNGNTDEFWLQSFPGTGAWTTWLEYGIVIPLNAGQNTIRFESAVSEGGPNIDYITLTLTDEPIAETFDPNSYQQMLDDAKPTIFIAGDSTVQSYRASYAPQQGWGYYLADYFTDGVNVANHSIAGRSSKKFYDEGRWATIADNLKEGDYVMIQFAINDSGASNADRYAPVCGDVNNPADGSYEWYMTEFIKSAQAKGATPILVTTVIGMKAYSNGKFVNSYTNYCDACKSLASKYNIPCIDLNTLMVDHYNSIGYNAALLYHLMGVVEGSTDGTHFTETGANAVAGLVANAVKSQKIAGLYGYVK